MKIAVWYHCVLSGKFIPSGDAAEQIMHEQMRALEKSGLNSAAEEVHVCVNGSDGDCLLAAVLATSKTEIHANGTKAVNELPTLAILRRWLKARTEPWAVLYHHSKGVSQPHDAYHHEHRRTMEHFCVWEWKKCVEDLEKGYDAVGCNLVHPKKRPVLPGCFFAGNFWWARSDYLAILSPIPEDGTDWRNTYERCIAERWIGEYSPRPSRMMDYERPHLYQ